MKEIDQEIIDKINSISFKKLNNYFLKFGNLITYKKEDDVVFQKFPKRINRKLLFKYLILSNDEMNLIKVKNCWKNDERITDIVTKISPNLHLKKLYNSILVK